jgi:hypothetical protein
MSNESIPDGGRQSSQPAEDASRDAGLAASCTVMYEIKGIGSWQNSAIAIGFTPRCTILLTQR